MDSKTVDICLDFYALHFTKKVITMIMMKASIINMQR